MATAEQAVLRHFSDGTPRPSGQLREEVPEVPDSRQGCAELVYWWLWSYGPDAVEDMAGAWKQMVESVRKKVESCHESQHQG